MSAPLGTDDGGRSVLLLILVGARISVIVGTVTALLAVTAGVLVGVAAVQWGRWPRFALDRIVEWFLALPALPLAIAVGVVLGGGLPGLVVAIALGMWPQVARLVRAQALTVGARPYVERARALGGGRWHVTRHHLLPGVAPMVASAAVLLVSDAILAAAALSFLGVRDDGGSSWGGLLRRAVDSGAFSSGAWWYVTAPGVAIAALSLSVAMMGRDLGGRGARR
jgi:peptide/nickel transport system permease protein